MRRNDERKVGPFECTFKKLISVQQQIVVEEETFSTGQQGKGCSVLLANKKFLCSSMALANHWEGLACCCADTSFSNAILLHGAH